MALGSWYLPFVITRDEKQPAHGAGGGPGQGMQRGLWLDNQIAFDFGERLQLIGGNIASQQRNA